MSRRITGSDTTLMIWPGGVYLSYRRRFNTRNQNIHRQLRKHEDIDPVNVSTASHFIDISLTKLFFFFTRSNTSFHGPRFSTWVEGPGGVRPGLDG